MQFYISKTYFKFSSRSQEVASELKIELSPLPSQVRCAVVAILESFIGVIQGAQLSTVQQASLACIAVCNCAFAARIWAKVRRGGTVYDVPGYCSLSERGIRVDKLKPQ